MRKRLLILGLSLCLALTMLSVTALASDMAATVYLRLDGQPATIEQIVPSGGTLELSASDDRVATLTASGTTGTYTAAIDNTTSYLPIVLDQSGAIQYYIAGAYFGPAPGTGQIYDSGTIDCYTLTLEKEAGIASVTGGGIYPSGSRTVTATPKEGYDFAGWREGDNPPTGTSSLSYYLNAATTLTATATPVVYSLSYTLGGGSAANPSSYTVESEAIALAAPTREGCRFTGWSGTGLTGNTNTSVTIEEGSTGDRTYTANWMREAPTTPPAGYSVAFTENSITVTASDHDYEYSVNGTDWFPSADGICTISGLVANATYSLQCRRPAITTPGPAAASLAFSLGTVTLTRPEDIVPPVPALTGSDPAGTDYGYTNAPQMTVNVTNQDTEQFTYSYKWFEGDGTDGEVITGQTAASCSVPADLSAGTHDYTVLVTAANRLNSEKTASAEKTFTVRVNPAEDSGAAVSMSGYTYGVTPPAPSIIGKDSTGAVTCYYNTSNQNSGGTEWTGMTGTALNAGDYYMYAVIAADGNYVETTTASVKFTIAKAILTPSVDTVEGKDYDGGTAADGTIALSGAAGGQSPTVTEAFAFTNKNAGTSTVDVSGIELEGSWGTNYAMSTTTLSGVAAPGGVQIGPKALDITAQTVAYNGTATLTVLDYTTGIGSETVMLTYTPYGKAAGVYSYSATAGAGGFTLALADPNYIIGSAGDLTVSAKALTIGAKTVTYSGSASSTEDITGANGETVTVTFTQSSKNVGNYTYSTTAGAGLYTVTLSDSADYSISSGGALTITPLPATLVWDYTAPFPYDGSAKTVTASVVNQISDDSFFMTYSENSSTERGNYTATVTGLGNDNYTLAGASGTTLAWRINAEAVNKPAADSTVFTYTGSEQTYAIAPNALYTVTDDKRTNAGSQTVTVALNDKENCTWADGSTDDVTFPFAIAKAGVTLPTAAAGLVYTGSDQTGVSSSSAGLYAVDGGMEKNAGSYTAAAGLNDPANYMWSGVGVHIRDMGFFFMTVELTTILLYTAGLKNDKSAQDDPFLEELWTALRISCLFQGAAAECGWRCEK